MEQKTATGDFSAATRTERSDSAISTPADNSDGDPITPEDKKVKRIIVAVHGIGDQFRFATIQSVVRQIAEFCDLSIPYPLGKFHASANTVRATPFEIPEDRKQALGKFADLGFAEVFWADIHQEAQKTKDTIEETKTWAQTMVDRMEALDRENLGDEGSVDYEKTAAVVKEMIETITTLENLCLIAEKMGMAKFELRDLLDDYLGAVQLVAEFKDYGGRIFAAFAGIMQKLVKRHGNVEEIYIVAHSEGTVVSFHSLLTALYCPSDPKNDWVKKVRGYMTIGSPIDKHIVMWPDLWKDFHEQEEEIQPEDKPAADRAGLLNATKDRRRVPWAEVGVVMPQPIVWWNYYDYGDPVGFMLDSTRLWLQDHLWVTVEDGTDADGKPARVLAKKQPFFDFPPTQDQGFTRYYLPGKAHNDYWTDPGVFGHFIDVVMEPKADPKAARPAPTSKLLPWAVSWIVPYFLCLLLLAGGTYLIYRAVDPLLKTAPPDATVAQSVKKLQSSATNTAELATNIATVVAKKAEAAPGQTGDAVPAPEVKPGAETIGDQQDSILQTVGTVFGLTFLLAGVTVASRIPRLVKSESWHFVSLGVFAIGTGAYFLWLSDRVRGNLAAAFYYFPWLGDGGVIVLAVVIAFVSSRISKKRPDLGMKPLMVLAAIATLIILVGLAKSPKWGGEDAPLWPLVLAGAAFLYLWWLAALIFDLTFVWHRYIRMNTTPDLMKGIRDKRRSAGAKKYAAAYVKPGAPKEA